jgi:hypothetical protein
MVIMENMQLALNFMATKLNLWESMKDGEVTTSPQQVPSALVTRLHFADNNGPTPPHQNFSIKTPYSEVLKTKFVNEMFLV